jgi:F-type H+-transporting ATPase subunit b
MNTFLWLAEAHKGFGLNFDILETNIINLSIIIGVLVYFGRGFLTSTLGDRRSAIEVAIQEAEARAKSAQSQLSEAQEKLTQAQAEAQRIRAKAEEQAQAAKAAILAKSEQDIASMRAAASQELNTSQEKAIAELRARAVALALAQVEQRLQGGLDEATQQRLVDRSLTLLGGTR